MYFIINVFLFVLSVVFLYGSATGDIPFTHGVFLFLSFNLISLLSVLSRKKPRRFLSFILYFIFFYLLCLAATFDEMEQYSAFDYSLVAAPLSIIPLLFKWRGFAAVGAIIGYWCSLIYIGMDSGSLFTFYSQYSTVLSNLELIVGSTGAGFIVFACFVLSISMTKHQV